MNNKYNVQLTVPSLYKKYDILIPINITIGEAILILVKSLNKITKDKFIIERNLYLYNSFDGEKYNLDNYIYETTIKNGSNLILC